MEMKRCQPKQTRKSASSLQLFQQCIHQGTGYRCTKIGKAGCGLPAGRYKNFKKHVVKKLMKLKTDKVQGPDAIHSRRLEETAEKLGKALEIMDPCQTMETSQSVLHA